jgi:hypothetical protein
MSVQESPCNYANSTATCSGGTWQVTPKGNVDAGNDVDAGDAGHDG